MHYHVTTDEGVIYETDDEQTASNLSKSIQGARVRMGSLAGLREKSRELFGSKWLKGPSRIAALAWAA